MPQGGLRDCALPLGENRLLRQRPQPGPHPGRGRLRRHRRSGPDPDRSLPGRCPCRGQWWTQSRVPRGRWPARDEAKRDHRASRAGPRHRRGYGVDLRFQPRLCDHQCRLSLMNEKFEQLIERAAQLLTRIESILPQPLSAPDWNASVAWRYRKRSSGHGVLEPVRHVAAIRLADLKEIEPQKEKIRRNTLQFVKGQPANNVLLTGARGTGKSSLIKACLNEYASEGLRLIEVDKADLVDLPDLVDVVAARPEKFIVYCDDLSFEEGEPGYKALKSILDGSVSAATANVLIYATSNRRHLLPEYMKENLSYKHTDDGEVHPGEVIEEKISLSERFGLWVSFYPFSQDEYLTIVAEWLRSFKVDAEAIAAARQEALVWALERGSRSGRVAFQFAKDYAGRHHA